MFSAKAKLFLVAALLGACGSLEAEDPKTLDEALSASYGGQEETDEAPAFGDAAIMGMSEDVPAGDTMTDGRPELDGARRVRALVIWGYLRPHPDAMETVDWSGSIKAENAALRVVRKVRFEQRDVILRPRTEVGSVEFTSQTRPYADGLVVEVILAPALNPEHKPVVLSFNSGPYTGSVTLEAGMRLTQVKKVDEAGHVVAYHIIRPNADGCTEGFLRGAWKQTGEVEGRPVGVLRGRFTADEGAIRGFLKGVWGTRKNGHQVWFAKVVDLEGKFLGVVVGRYADGKFGGLFVGRGRKVIGAVHGEIGDADSDADGGFVGRYTERCGEAAGEGQPPASDEPEISLDDSTP